MAYTVHYLIHDIDNTSQKKVNKEDVEIKEGRVQKIKGLTATEMSALEEAVFRGEVITMGATIVEPVITKIEYHTNSKNVRGNREEVIWQTTEERGEDCLREIQKVINTPTPIIETIKEQYKKPYKIMIGRLEASYGKECKTEEEMRKCIREEVDGYNKVQRELCIKEMQSLYEKAKKGEIALLYKKPMIENGVVRGYEAIIYKEDRVGKIDIKEYRNNIEKMENTWGEIHMLENHYIKLQVIEYGKKKGQEREER